MLIRLDLMSLATLLLFSKTLFLVKKMLLRHKVSLDFGVMKHRITEKLSTYYCFKYSVTFKHSG